MTTQSSQTPQETSRYRPLLRKDIEKMPQIQKMNDEDRWIMLAVSAVLPFRTNKYVMEELINWDQVPNDPMFQLTFPQREMLEEEDFQKVYQLVKKGVPTKELNAVANEIRYKLNPHPAGQMEHNTPKVDGVTIPGVQHKYRDTCLIFPSQGQTCHAYCTYCFRWAQFVGIQDLKFATREVELVHQYLKEHPEISDTLFTGGDPMIMKTKHLRNYIEPLLGPGFEHIRHIRIGTKSLAYWPQRFVTDEDADDFLRLVEEIRQAGKLPAIMAHFTHPVELSTDIVKEAIRRLQNAGAIIRTQSPIVQHVNDDADTWAEMWRIQAKMGCIPYYMFVERDTGAKNYFEIPLEKAYNIFQTAYKQVSGLCRTVRGPSMSAMPGKVQVDGITEVAGEKVFILTMLRGRNNEWVRRPFFAKYNPNATWLNHLEPAFADKFFWEQEDVNSKEEAKENIEETLKV